MNTKEELVNAVVDAYLSVGLTKTAAECGISESKTRKILITKGLWHDERTEAIRSLREQGLSSAEIAAKLHISIKSVNAFSPYDRPIYGVDQSKNAAKIKAWRQNKKHD